MSESHEPSYYEIALTNRQVLFAFVILLVCLLGAFIAGVWVGRGGEIAVAAVTPPAEGTAAGSGAEDGTEVGGEELEKLSFFGEERADGPGTTLRDDLAAGEPTGGTPPAPAPPQPSPAAPMPAPPAAQAPAVSQPEPAAPPAAAPATATGGLVVQVFSSRDEEQAKKVVDRLNRAGITAFLSPVEVSGQTMYRVRMGPYSDRAEAQRVADQVRREHKLDTWITQ